MDLDLGNENDWQKAIAIMLLWATIVTCNWYFL